MTMCNKMHKLDEINRKYQSKQIKNKFTITCKMTNVT